MTSKLQVYCESLMEASWLAAAAVIPLFFNFSSARTFEPDKIYVLEFLAILAGTAWAAKRLNTGKRRDHAEAMPPPPQGYSPTAAVLFLVLIYTVSSVFSIVPLQSWWGSYQRAQGTIAFYGYVVLFLVVLSELRSPAQLRRIQFSFIIGSLPVASYAILQYIGLDFVRWYDPVLRRPSASMGNPIFLGAYLVMVIPLTVSRLVDAAGMLRTDSRRKPGVILGCCCGLVLVLQMFALLSTRSRGPVLGLAAAGYLCFFTLLVLKRSPGAKSLWSWTAAALAGCVAPLLVIAVARMVTRFPANLGIACVGASLLVVAALYISVWRTRWGRDLFWMTWLAQTLMLICFFAIGSSRLLGEGVKMRSAFGRLAYFSGATVDVRVRLWQTGMDAIRAAGSAPLDGVRQDLFPFLRSAIGYGPECIGLAANRHAVPELVRFHTGQTVDRLHNEVFDNLISIGLAGAIASLLVVAAAFYSAMSFLGFLSEGRRKVLFLVLSAAGSAAGILFPWVAGSPHLAGIGVLGGLLAGVFTFVAWSGFLGISDPLDGKKPLALCILAALTAHFVETGFGIAVTPTRLCFFLLLAVLSILAAGKLTREDFSKRRAPESRWFQNPLLPFAAIVSFLVFAEAWCFVINTNQERSALGLFLRTWFARSPGSGFSLPGTMIILALTFCGSIGLMAGELPDLGLRKPRFWKTALLPLMLPAFLWLGGGLLAAFFWTALVPGAASPLNVSLRAEARITFFILGLLLLLVAATPSLVAADSSHRAAAAPIRMPVLGLCLLLAICACALIHRLTLRPAWADSAQRIAASCESSGEFAAAVQIYNRAAKLSPGTAAYPIALGYAGIGGGLSERNPSRREAMLGSAEKAFQRALALNPLDPAGHRAMGSFYMQTGERLSDAAAKDATIRRALPFFRRAAQLAPNYPQAYTELGRCHFLLGEDDRAMELYDKALRMNPSFARTHMFLGEMQYRQGNIEQALRSFSNAYRLDWNNLEARKNAGFLLTILGREKDAIRVYLQALARAPQDLLLLRRLAALYFRAGDFAAGEVYARRAYDLTPPAEKGTFDAFAQELQAPARQSP